MTFGESSFMPASQLRKLLKPQRQPKMDAGLYRNFLEGSEEVKFSGWRSFDYTETRTDRQKAWTILVVAGILGYGANHYFDGPLATVFASIALVVVVAAAVYLYMKPFVTNLFYVITDQRIILFSINETNAVVSQDASIMFKDVGKAELSGVRGYGEIKIEPKKFGISGLWKEQAKEFTISGIQHPEKLFEYLSSRIR